MYKNKINKVLKNIFLPAFIGLVSLLGLVSFLGLGLGKIAFAQEGDPLVNPQPFEEWVEDLRAEALGKGISADILDVALANIKPNARVIELDRNQPEFTQTYQEYLSRRVSETRIKRGREMMVKHRVLLNEVAEKYNVQPRFIVAIWGMETNYGSFNGGMDVIQSLATLAYDPRRSAFFRTELIGALQILNDGHINYENMKGSWGGAMGQSQFMPTSFQNFAQDFDGDGKRDIWTNEADVFASIANYLKKQKWNGAFTWGRQVSLPENFSDFSDDIANPNPPRSCRRSMRHHSKRLPLATWQNYGLRRLNGDDLPKVDIGATLLRPAGDYGPAYLTYSNFRSILGYNCANYYALAVSHLADAFRRD